MCSRKALREARERVDQALGAMIAAEPAAPPPPPVRVDHDAAAERLLAACEAADCLCLNPESVGDQLRTAYGRIVAEPVPVSMIELLAQLPAEQGRRVERPTLRLRGGKR